MTARNQTRPVGGGISPICSNGTSCRAKSSGIDKDLLGWSSAGTNATTFRGEEAYDQDRRGFLHKKFLKCCVGTDNKLAEPKERYRNNRTVMEKLDRYEPQIER
jgi:hypothetical protein